MEHTHLDRQRREPGICPACDLAWAQQREHLISVATLDAAITEVDRLGKSLGASRERWSRYSEESSTDD